MSGTNVYDAKTAVFDRLAEQTGTGLPLAGVQVSYEWPGQNAEMECVYGGGVRFEHADAVAESNTLALEIALVSIYIRVVSRPRCTVQKTDARAAEIVRAIGAYLARNPDVAPQLELSWVGLHMGQGDYEQSEDETISILSVQLKILSYVGFGYG